MPYSSIFDEKPRKPIERRSNPLSSGPPAKPPRVVDPFSEKSRRAEASLTPRDARPAVNPRTIIRPPRQDTPLQREISAKRAILAARLRHAAEEHTRTTGQSANGQFDVIARTGAAHRSCSFYRLIMIEKSGVLPEDLADLATFYNKPQKWFLTPP